MKVIVIGAGVVGVTTAYRLCKAGHEVVLLDELGVPGHGTSYANGGQLSFAYRTPIAGLPVLKAMPKILLGQDSAFSVSLLQNIHFYRWGLSFLYECLPRRSSAASSSMQALGQLSKQRFYELVEDTNIHFDYRKDAGKLYTYDTLIGFEQAKLAASSPSMSADELHARYAVFNQSSSLLAGGVFDAAEGAGDCQQFSENLVRYLQERYQLVFLPNCRVEAIEEVSKKVSKAITSLKTNQGAFEADRYVLCTGVTSNTLLRQLNIRLPVIGMKGYSVTVPATKQCPDISITHADKKTVYCKLGNRLRIAGFADFSSVARTSDIQVKTDELLNNARAYLPHAGDYDRVLDRWCGERPVTPDSLPIVGKSPIENLYLNVGHGMLGWTYSSGTADLLMQSMDGDINSQNVGHTSVSPSLKGITLEDYAFSRF
ncbi:MAG: D-amino-acid dehydrogenase [Candidatus Endobugula sp.]|jgi:D-amino-acid dehydrogenase